jgi:hypothetical protein
MAISQDGLRVQAGCLLTFLRIRPDLVDELQMPFKAQDIIDYLQNIGIKPAEIVCDTQDPHVARLALHNLLFYAAPIFGPFNRGKKFGRRPIGKLRKRLIAEARNYPNPWSNVSYRAI